LLSSPAAFVQQMLAELTALSAGFLPVTPDTGGSGHVIGFGYLTDLRPDSPLHEEDEDYERRFLVTKRDDRIAWENASAVLMRPLGGSGRGGFDSNIGVLLEEHRGFGQPLLAPALLR
jgi:hypothetical protein